jgi:hypothetical protein
MLILWKKNKTKQNKTKQNNIFYIYSIASVGRAILRNDQTAGKHLIAQRTRHFACKEQKMGRKRTHIKTRSELI